MLTVASVTIWLDYLLNIWPFTTMKISPKALKFVKEGFKFGLTLNKP